MKVCIKGTLSFEDPVFVGTKTVDSSEQADVLVVEDSDSDSLLQFFSELGHPYQGGVVSLKSVFMRDDLELASYLLDQEGVTWHQVLEQFSKGLFDRTGIEQFSSKSAKDDCLKAHLSVLEKNKLPSWAIDRFQRAWSEMAMNGLYDARSGRADVLEQSHFVKSLVIINHDTLLFGCLDFFGTLASENLFGQIHTVQKVGARNAMRTDEKGGAGLGGAIILDSVNSLCVAVKPGEFSFVGGRIAFRGGSKRFEESPKNILSVVLK